MNPDRIERYIAKKMTPDEMREFELEMNQDPQLRQEVLGLQEATKALRIYERSTIKNRLIEREQRIFNSKSEKKSNKSIWYLFSGLFILLIIWIWYLVSNKSSDGFQHNQTLIQADSISNSNQNLIDTVKLKEEIKSEDLNHKNKTDKKNSEELFAMHFKPYTDELLESAIRGEEGQTIFEQFQYLYAIGKFDEALKSFELLEPVMKENDNVLFLKANALIATNRISLATPILQAIIKNEESRYLKEAYWYLGLCAIRNGEISLAKKYLNNDLLKGNKKALQLLLKI